LAFGRLPSVATGTLAPFAFCPAVAFGRRLSVAALLPGRACLALFGRLTALSRFATLPVFAALARGVPVALALRALRRLALRRRLLGTVIGLSCRLIRLFCGFPGGLLGFSGRRLGSLPSLRFGGRPG